MAGHPIVVIVNDAEIARLFGEGEDIQRWTSAVTVRATGMARAKAPVDTGRMAASISGYANRFYTYGRRMALFSDVFYTPFVEVGTANDGYGRIVANNPPYYVFRLPFYRNGRTIAVHSVRGQRGQHFLRDGMVEACLLAGVALPSLAYEFG